MLLTQRTYQLKSLVMGTIYFEKKGAQLLKEIGMSKSEFARRMGIQKQNVNTLFKTKNLETIRRASDVMGVPFGLLIGYTEEPETDGFVSTGNRFVDPPFNAFWNLIDTQNGFVPGLYHRNDLGDIDLCWGDKDGGVCNIMLKQIENKDFASVNQMIVQISDVIESGNMTLESAYKASLKKDDITVVLKFYSKKHGTVKEPGNWVIATYLKGDN